MSVIVVKEPAQSVIVVKKPSESVVVVKKLSESVIVVEKPAESVIVVQKIMPPVIVVKPVSPSIVVAAIRGPTGIQGGQGDQGPLGPTGPMGPAGSSYIHSQGVPSSSWNINHNLGMFPNITIIDSGGSVVEGDENYVDQNTVVLTFSGAFSGTAYLS